MTKTTPSGFIVLGINEDDFIDNELKDFGRTVFLEVVTGTIDSMGNITTEVVTGSSNVSAVFHERSKTRVRTPEGEIELAPAFLMSRIDDNVGTGNKITIDDKTWRVFNRINRKGIFRYHDLYLWDK